MKHTCTHTDRPIFSKGRCKPCTLKSYKPLQRTPIKNKAYKIPKVSKKRSAQLKVYADMRVVFLLKNDKCQIRLPGCTDIATEIHHLQGKEGLLLIAEGNLKSVCRHCHDIVTEHSKEAIAAGYSISRHTINT